MMIPGQILSADGEIEINVGRECIRVDVANTGDRPIQVGSHYHFFETNDALDFERARTRGFRLNIPAGTAVRFEPGQSRNVELVRLAGDANVYGFKARVMGPLAAAPTKKARVAAAKKPTKAPAKKPAVKPATRPATKRGSRT